MGSLHSEMLNDMNGITADENKLGRLSKLISTVSSYDEMIADMEGKLAAVKKQRADLTDRMIPDLFDEIGVKEIKLDDGTKVKIKEFYATSVSKANKPAAIKWLEDNDFGDIVKKAFIIDDPADPEEKKKIAKMLEEASIWYTVDASIHPQTLKAFVNEQIPKGVDIPDKLFGVFPVKTTEIKTFKNR